MFLACLFGTAALSLSPLPEARASRGGLRGNPPPHVTAALPKSTGGKRDSRRLNGLLISTTTARELMELHAQCGSDFNHVNLATCWSRLGRVRSPGERRWLLSDDGARLVALREQTRERVCTFRARQVANTAHALAKLALRGAAWESLWSEIDRAVLACRSEFDPQGLANTAWAFATTGRAAPAPFEAIGEEAARRVCEFKAQELANMAWAFVTAGRAAPALFEAIAQESSRRVREFNPQALTNTVWAFATGGHAAPALFEAIAEESAGRVHEFDPQGLANTAWAFATAGRAAPALFEAIAEESAGRVREFKPQELANMVWAFATAGHAAPALFEAIAGETAGRVRDFNSQALANTAWAFARAGHAAPVLLDAIAEEAAGRVREFTSQALANTVWAFATADHAASVLLDAIAEEAARRVREFSPQALANMAWAFTTAGHAAPALFDAIAVEAVRRVSQFKSQELANTVWAFATAGHAAPALFEVIAEESAGRVREFKPQGLANTAWAFATAGRTAPALFRAIGLEAAGRMGEFNPQTLAITAWAFAAADALPIPSSLFDQRFACRCDALADEFSVENLCQLHQWRLWYESERGCSEGLPGAALLARCGASFRASEAQPSRLQRLVAEMLVAQGASVQEEVVLEEGYSLDLVVHWRGERLAVEVDGPSHFVGREPNGATLLKRRQLKHFGWRLVSVPYLEWNDQDHREKSKEREQRAAYLASLLADAAADPDSSLGASAAAALGVGEVREVGPKRAGKLHAVGITRAVQLAQLSDEEAERIAASAGISSKTLATCVLNARQLTS